MNPTPESQGEFQRLVSAFETLSDPQKRQQWDASPTSRRARSARSRRATARGEHGITRFHTCSVTIHQRPSRLGKSTQPSPNHLRRGEGVSAGRAALRAATGVPDATTHTLGTGRAQSAHMQ